MRAVSSRNNARPALRSCAVAAALVIGELFAVVAAAQTAPAPAASYDTLLFRALAWRSIGPYRGGRSVSVAGSASRPYEYWFGTTGGGVFKTTDGGYHWTSPSDKYFGGTIGAIGVSESNPDIVYVGTGENDIRGNMSHGDGVYKTTNGGKTWTHVGLAETRQISRVRVDPHNPDIVYVGALGHVWAPNPERGVFKSTDGGKTWTRILFRNDSTGITDLVLDPTDSRTIYAAFWQAGRKPWIMVSGGAGSGIFKSTDAGATWTELTRNPGLPGGIIGNIGLAVSPTNPRRVWALVEADSGGVFRSDDGGQTWTRTNSERKLRQRAWYYSRIFADPKDPNVVYALNTNFYRSSDGGKTFKNVPVPHGDNHDLWIAPNDGQRMIEGNDGSANISFNGGKAWSEQDNASAQFYHVTTTMDFPYKVCGAQQDNTTLCGPSAQVGGIDIAEWREVGGGESGYIQVRPDNTDIVYAGSYSYLSRKDMRTGLQKEITPYPENPMGHSAEDLKYRFQWTFPIEISPHDPHTLYVGANVVFKSSTDGQTWQVISPDLTRHDPATLGPSGGPITKDQTSVEYYATIFAIAESPVKPGLIWTGSDDGVVEVTRDGGAAWTNVSPNQWGDWMRISSIEPSHYDPGTVYVAANRYQLDDMRPYLFKSTDYGHSWTLITNGIPADQFTRVLREDPVRRGLLYAGTERGVWVSFDGAHWQSLQRNLPPVPIHDLVVKDNDLVAASHGRSFWILSNVSPLRQLTPAVASARVHLFKPAPAYRVSWANNGPQTGAHPRGTNPPNGAMIYYTLPDSTSAVTMEFLDSAGHLVRRLNSRLDSAGMADSVEHADSVRVVRRDSLTKAGLSADSIRKLLAIPDTTQAAGGNAAFGDEESHHVPRPPRVPAKTGLNMFAWNMRYPDASAFEGLIMWAGNVAGPVAPPGRYTVRLIVGSDVQSQPLIIKADPRSTATQEAIEAQFALLMRIHDRLSAANNAVKTIRNVKYQIATDSAAGAPPGFVAAAAPLVARIDSIEAEIYQVKNQSGQDPLNYPIRLNNKIASLANTVASANGRPTAPSYAVITTLSAELETQLVALKTVLANELPKLNAMLRAAGQPEIVPHPTDPPLKKPAPAPVTSMTESMQTPHAHILLAALCAASLGAAAARAQSPAQPVVPERAYAAMRWRLVGPFRGGRSLAIEGIPGDPATFYFGGVAGGVWRSRDAGTTWEPLTDGQPFASIGALAIAPSDPNTIYVGTGEADMRSNITYGQGIWKSTDAGAHWQSLGLTDTRQIGRILVDPHDARVLLVAALGHAYGPNAERGVFRSIDGGQNWTKVLYRDEHTGAIDLAFDPGDPRVVYAALWQAQRTPWSQYPPNEGPGSGLFKSSDGGLTWTEITGHGLPAGQLGRIGLAVAHGSAGAIAYALCSEAKNGAGVYRSDDGGATWRLAGTDARMGRGWYFGQIFVDPTDANVLYVPNQSILKSTDGGHSFTAIKGMPGGDDYHYMWIDPASPRHLAFASDQGVGVSFNGGETWSSWYNQPTAQFYHVITDNRWPYTIYGAQQDAGAIAISSRSDFGEITFRDWFPPGAGESGYIAPDPRDSTVVYGGGTYGEMFRFDRTTGQLQDIRPWPQGSFGTPMPDRKYRFTWTSPVVFDPIDKRTLYFGSQILLRTTDGGLHWQEASPDLTGAAPGPQRPTGVPTIADAAAKGWAVIYTIAPSPLREGMIWVGTDNGRIQLTTTAGAHWQDVTPPGLDPWSKISIIDASSLDTGAAYAAVDRHRLDDIGPYIYRTHDYGRHWARADAGIPPGAYVRSVRADPVRRGLLFAGTELGPFVSFDDGDHWQSLQLNLPMSPVHDLAVHDGDLIVATHGRAFWVLDDITPLRQLTPVMVQSAARLLRPATAIRLRQSENRETPLPPEVPHGENAPTGAIIDYWLASTPSGPVTIDILDERGAVVRHFASDLPTDTVRASEPAAPPYFMSRWLPHAQPLTAHAGHNRFVWNLRLPRPSVPVYEYSSAYVPATGTEAQPAGPLVVPGEYRVRLTVAGTTEVQPLRVVLDPRERVAPAALAAQFALALQVTFAMSEAAALDRSVRGVQDSLTARRASSPPSGIASAMADLARSIDSIRVGETLTSLGELEMSIESADRMPTAAMHGVYAALRAQLTAQHQRWSGMVEPQITALDARLQAAGLSKLGATPH